MSDVHALWRRLRGRGRLIQELREFRGNVDEPPSDQLGRQGQDVAAQNWQQGNYGRAAVGATAGTVLRGFSYVPSTLGWVGRQFGF